MKTLQTSATYRKIIRYYEEAGLDYQTWSKSFNMHFGYWKWGLNPFRLGTLHDQMNLEVMERRQVKATRPRSFLMWVVAVRRPPGTLLGPAKPGHQ